MLLFAVFPDLLIFFEMQLFFCNEFSKWLHDVTKYSYDLSKPHCSRGPVIWRWMTMKSVYRLKCLYHCNKFFCCSWHEWRFKGVANSDKAPLYYQMSSELSLWSIIMVQITSCRSCQLRYFSGTDSNWEDDNEPPRVCSH